MEKAKIYARAIWKVSEFYIRRHPYLSVWLGVWFAGCIWNAFKAGDARWCALFLAVTILTWILHLIYVFLDEFASPWAKSKRIRRKIETREKLIEYLKNEL